MPFDPDEDAFDAWQVKERDAGRLTTITEYDPEIDEEVPVEPDPDWIKDLKDRIRDDEEQATEVIKNGLTDDA